MEQLSREGKVLPGLPCDLTTHFCFLYNVLSTQEAWRGPLDCPVCSRVDLGSRPHFLCCARCAVPFVEQAVAPGDGHSLCQSSQRPGLVTLLLLLCCPEV